LLLFFFNAPATTEIYTLSLHDALPILHRDEVGKVRVRLDAARDNDLPRRVDHPPGLRSRVGQADGDDALTLDSHVPPADALRRHDVASANHEIQHGPASRRTFPCPGRSSTAATVCSTYHAGGARSRRRTPRPAIIGADGGGTMTAESSTTVGLLHPGDMGAAVGATVVAGGARVLWASAGRSAA